MSQLVRVHQFSVSADGFGAGDDLSLERPFGTIDGDALHGWMFDTASWRGEGGRYGLDEYITRDFANNIGAEIMGRNKYSPHRGPHNHAEWQGWWGENPPFHTPVFVLTHYPCEPLTLTDTTFHFIDASPSDALRKAKDASNGKDVRIGGGVSTIRQFLDAGLIDTLHIAVVPFTAGAGQRLWNDPSELEDRYHHESVISPSSVTHHFFWRK